jgi:hypothetical protein
MARKKYDDNCPDCQPAIVDPTSGKVLPKDHPAMVAMMNVWKSTTLQEREAYHRVMCLNSRADADMAIVHSIVNRFQLLTSG